MNKRKSRRKKLGPGQLNSSRKDTYSLEACLFIAGKVTPVFFPRHINPYDPRFQDAFMAICFLYQVGGTAQKYHGSITVMVTEDIFRLKTVKDVFQKHNIKNGLRKFARFNAYCVYRVNMPLLKAIWLRRFVL